ncbi:DUF6074 family protein [Methylobacterium sp. D54C]
MSAVVLPFRFARRLPQIRKTASYMTTVPSNHAEGHLREQLRRLEDGLRKKGVAEPLIRSEVGSYEGAVRAPMAPPDQPGGCRVSKNGHKGNGKKEPPHVRLYDWLTDSAAWLDLSTDARALYVLLKKKYRGMNNGRIILSVRQAAENLKVSKTSASKAFLELQVHGFIEVVILGGFDSRKDGRATEWRLTEHPCDVAAELPTRRFMSWAPGKDFTVPQGGRSVPQGGQSVPQGGLMDQRIPRIVPLRGP